MKFIHMADMHLDSPFTVLSRKEHAGEKRRLEQREALRKIITYIKENKIEYLFIAGDLYEHEHIRETSIQYVNQLFTQIPDTNIYIAPGNHDPYLPNSMYQNMKWSENVTIFGPNVKCVETPKADIYGIGFNDFYFKSLEIEKIQIKNKQKINILIVHGTLDGSEAIETPYQPLNKNKLKELGFDYIALGHIHKPNYSVEENQTIVYPGSTMSLGFDEQGKHGAILGEITKEKINLEFLPIDTKEFKEEKLNITSISSKEELIEKINEMELKENTFYKIILTGKRNFEINVYHLYPFILKENIIKIKDETTINININELAKEINLKGLFLKEILEDIKSGKINQEKAEKIIEIGLDILK